MYMRFWSSAAGLVNPIYTSLISNILYTCHLLRLSFLGYYVIQYIVMILPFSNLCTLFTLFQLVGWQFSRACDLEFEHRL